MTEMGSKLKGRRLKWVLVKGARHGFTQGWGRAADAEKSKRDADEKDALVGEWLFRGPFRTAN